MFTWHGYGIGIYPTQVSPCLCSHTVAWHSWRCHSWRRRRAWGRRRMINFLPWKCHGCCRMRTGGRTRWLARNHDRNEVLCVALFPSPVFDEMWFLTIDPFVGISVFIAKLSERQYCWRILEDFHSQEYIQFFDKLWPLPCVCTSPLAVMTIVGLHDFVKVSISPEFKSFLLIMCIDAPESTTNSRSSGLRIDGAGKPVRSEGEKNAALFFSFNFEDAF